jgi:hypothetical protein
MKFRQEMVEFHGDGRSMPLIIQSTARPMVSLLYGMLHHTIAMSGTLTASTPSDINHSAEENCRLSGLKHHG